MNKYLFKVFESEAFWKQEYKYDTKDSQLPISFGIMNPFGELSSLKLHSRESQKYMYDSGYQIKDQYTVIALLQT